MSFVLAKAAIGAVVDPITLVLVILQPLASVMITE
jgi:hypothetical protein